jgi:hypothetical protein
LQRHLCWRRKNSGDFWRREEKNFDWSGIAHQPLDDLP